MNPGNDNIIAEYLLFKLTLITSKQTKNKKNWFYTKIDITREI